MKAPRLIIQNGFPKIEGDFEFEISSEPIIINEDFTPIKKIYFGWCPEFYQDLNAFNINELYEILGEKLKQDFIKALKTQMTNVKENMASNN